MARLQLIQNMPKDLDTAFVTALEQHRAGRLVEAESGYREILARSPSHSDAMHLLGVIALQT